MTHADKLRAQTVEASNGFWSRQLERIPKIMEAYVKEGYTSVTFRIPREGVKIRRIPKLVFFSTYMIEPAGWTNDMITRFREFGYKAELQHCWCEQGYLGSEVLVSIPNVPGGRPTGGYDFLAGPQTAPVVLYTKE